MDPGTLTEGDILARSRQYDIELVYAVTLKSVGFTSLGSALLRCVTLTALDIGQNKLKSLAGLREAVEHGSCKQLEWLNVAENQLEDISDLAACQSLQHIYLEGNMLKTKASLSPLATLPHLTEVRLIRSIMVDGAPFVLDNPVCGRTAAETAAYHAMMNDMLPSVRWIDGRVFRGGDNDGTGGGAEEGDRRGRNDLETAMASLEGVSKELLVATTEERELRKLLTS